MKDIEVVIFDRVLTREGMEAFAAGKEPSIPEENKFMSVAQAKEANLFQLYNVGMPGHKIVVGDGRRTIRYIDWLKAEAERIRSDPERLAFVVEHSPGSVSLWANKPAGYIEMGDEEC